MKVHKVSFLPKKISDHCIKLRQDTDFFVPSGITLRNRKHSMTLNGMKFQPLMVRRQIQ